MEEWWWMNPHEKKMTMIMKCVVLPSLHNVLHNGACWCCYTILLLHINTHCYHCITTCYHCYTIVTLLSMTQKMGNTNNITNFNIKQPYPKQENNKGTMVNLLTWKKTTKASKKVTCSYWNTSPNCVRLISKASS
jgi:hypothetical protein